MNDFERVFLVDGEVEDNTNTNAQEWIQLKEWDHTQDRTRND